MQWLIKIVAFAVLALWLPATLHCNLEAAGVIAHEVVGSACDDTSDPCSRDSCDVVEDALARPTVVVAKTFAPTLTLCLCVVCSRLALTSPSETPTLAVSATERPIDWLPTWPFSRRTALPARAPNRAV